MQAAPCSPSPGVGGGKEDALSLPSVIGCRWLRAPSVPTDRGTLRGRVSGNPWRPHLQQPGRQEKPGNGVWAEPHQLHFLSPPTLPPFHPSSLPSFLPSFPPLPPFYPSFFFTFKQSMENLCDVSHKVKISQDYFFFTNSHARLHAFIKFSIFSYCFEMMLLSHINLLYALG